MNSKVNDGVRSLSVKEIKALQCAAEGLGNKATALRIGVSIETVKDYRSAAFLKLDALNVTHAVALAMASGIIKLEAPK